MRPSRVVDVGIHGLVVGVEWGRVGSVEVLLELRWGRREGRVHALGIRVGWILGLFRLSIGLIECGLEVVPLVVAIGCDEEQHQDANSDSKSWPKPRPISVDTSVSAVPIMLSILHGKRMASQPQYHNSLNPHLFSLILFPQMITKLTYTLSI